MVLNFFKKNWEHFAVLAFFLVVVFVYVSPQFQGKSVNQGDVTQYIGAANESYWFKDATGQEQLWSNSMFGGMPTVQTTLVYPGNYIGRTVINFINWFPAPGGMLLLHLIGFYILLLAFKVNRWLAIIGAIAFAFSTYEIIILAAGHNSKSLAVAFLPMVLGGFFLAYRTRFWLGIGLSALFMTFQLSCNHFQVTYYLGILLLIVGIGEFIRAFSKKELKSFFITSAALVGVYVLALAVNYGNISLTNDYAKSTIRGGNDLEYNSEGQIDEISTKGGLDKDYITTWSYGKGESFTFLSPYVKGGASEPFGSSPFTDIVDGVSEENRFTRSEKESVYRYPSYWGEQPMTAGPFYMGVLMFFFAFLGMFFIKDTIKWPLLIVGVLALLLSWGKNYMGFTEFWLDYVPGYNKFRTVTIILVLVELIIPLIAILFLDLLVKNKNSFIENKKKLIIVSSSFLVFLLLLKFVGLDDQYMSESFDVRQLNRIESQITQQIRNEDPTVLKEQYGIDVTNSTQVNEFVNTQMTRYEDDLLRVKNVRKEVYQSSINRSLLFTVFGIIILLSFVLTSINSVVFISAVGLLIATDLIGVSLNYLNTDDKYWVDAGEKKYPFTSSKIDEQIMENEIKLNPELGDLISKAEKEKKKEIRDSDYKPLVKKRVIEREKFAILNQNTNYRVFDFSGGFSSAKPSYFHKSLGGYHGAKLRTIQNMFEFHLSNSNAEMFNMLNVKYFFQPSNSGELLLSTNYGANGNVWFVNEIKVYPTRYEEIVALGDHFFIKNVSDKILLVNGKPVTEMAVRGSEIIQLVKGQDTLKVEFPGGMKQEMKFSYVEDALGSYNFVPIQTLEKDTLSSFLKVLDVDFEKFDSKNEAVIAKENLGSLKTFNFHEKGEIHMTKYSPMELLYEANTSGDEFVVFSEMFYKDGWKAYVNDKEVDILNVNYVLRGIQLHEGNSKIRFVYSSDKYDMSNILSFILSTIVLLVFGFSIWKNNSINSEKGES